MKTLTRFEAGIIIYLLGMASGILLITIILKFSGSSSAITAEPVTATTQSEKLSGFEIKGVDAKITEKNSTWWRVSWQITVKNDGRPRSLDAEIDFLDGDGFVIETEQEYGLTVSAGEEKTFSGYSLINARTAATMANVKARIR